MSPENTTNPTTIIPPGTQIGMLVNHGHLTHPTYGQVNANCTIPLMLPSGAFSAHHTESDQSTVDAYITKILPSYRPLWPDDLDDQILARLQDFLTISTHVLPDADPGHQDEKLDLVFGHTALGFALDDVIDNLSDMDAFQFSDAWHGIDILQKLYSGTFKNWEDVPNLTPEMSGYNQHVFNVIKKAEALVPDKMEELMGDLMEGYLGHVLLMEPKNEFTRNSNDVFRSHASGGTLVLQVIAAFSCPKLPSTLKYNPLFQRLKMCIGNETDLMNYVIGLRRDMEKDQVKDSSILTAVVKEGMSLQAAFDKTCKEMIGNLMDIRVAVRKLGELYKGDEGVQGYLRCAQHYVDGQVYAYSRIKRYGGIEFKVVAVS